MRKKHKKALLAAAVLLGVGLVIAAMISPALAIVAVGVMQIAVLVLLVDSRPTIVSRAAARARRLRKRVTPTSRAAVSSASREDPASAALRKRMRAQDVKLIRASLVFDQEWYEAQAGAAFESINDAIVDYLVKGHRAGHSPHVLFNPLEPRSWASAVSHPNLLVAYLKNEGELWGKPTSLLFDPARLDNSLSSSDFSPLTAFLRNRGSDAPLPYEADPWFLRDGLTLDDVRPFLLSQHKRWQANDALLAPTRKTVEEPAPTQELAEAVAAFVSRSDEPPLVSVILPTWNRAGTLAASIESIANQSYAAWELIVADDGSIDDTALVLEAASSRDERITPLALEHRGVSAARNAALARARGEFVAFLDSDNAWEPDFLLSMVAFLETYGHDAAYSMVEVTLNGEKFFRTVPATRESLRVANSIAQPALVARRSLIERAGGFDESLLRAVDYDLVLSLSDLTELVQVPYVGLRYSEDDQDPNRISEAQSIAWNFYVRDRHRWAAATLPECQPGLVSIIIDDARSPLELHTTLTSLRRHLGDLPTEIFILPTSNSWSAVQSFTLAEFSTMDVHVLPIVGVAHRAALRINHALRAARGEYVFVTTAQHRYIDGTISDLIATLTSSDAAAVHPVVLDDNLLIADAGVVYGSNGKDPIGLLHGLPSDWPCWSSTSVEVPGATLPLLMRGSTVRSLHGLNTKLRQLWADIDLSQRAAELEAKPVIVKTNHAVQLHGVSEFARGLGLEQDVRMFASLWPEAPAGSVEAVRAAGASATFEGFAAVSVPHDPNMWSHATWRPRDDGILDVVDRPQRPLQWSIKTATPAEARAVTWGDFHFAQALADALRSLNQRVSVDFGTNVARASASSDDVVLTLRGLTSVPIPSEATSLVWVISHPDKVSARELGTYDLRYAASATWPTMMASQWGIDITPLLQCTDPQRFYIDDVSVPDVSGKLLMVGNSRRQYRPAANAAANAGLPILIYGSDWEDFVSAEYIAGSYVPNEELQRYYRSAQWALNDHWPEMRDHGFISNRVFDVLAAGGRLLSDDVTGLDSLVPRDVLPHGIATFRSPLELLAVVDAGTAVYYPEGSLEAVSDHVRAHHSFESRAKVMLEDVRRHRAQRAL